MVKAVIYDMFETLITHYHGASPVYFGSEMAADAGIEEAIYLKRWRESEPDRSIGKYSIKAIVREILETNDRYSPELVNKLVGKMRLAKEECFRNIHPEIVPMLKGLKANGIKIGLVSNCYDVEADVIRESVVYPFFGAVCFSCDEGIRKPDEEIFLRCVRRLGVKPEECIYIGDGGADELAVSRSLGMHAMQAAWYLIDHHWQPASRMEEYEPLDRPLELLERIAEKIEENK